MIHSCVKRLLTLCWANQPCEDRDEKALSEKRLLERCEVWSAEVPDGVAVLTAGIDTQDDRFKRGLIYRMIALKLRSLTGA